MYNINNIKRADNLKKKRERNNYIVNITNQTIWVKRNYLNIFYILGRNYEWPNC